MIANLAFGLCICSLVVISILIGMSILLDVLLCAGGEVAELLLMPFFTVACGFLFFGWPMAYGAWRNCKEHHSDGHYCCDRHRGSGRTDFVGHRFRRRNEIAFRFNRESLCASRVSRKCVIRYKVRFMPRSCSGSGRGFQG